MVKVASQRGATVLCHSGVLRSLSSFYVSNFTQEEYLSIAFASFEECPRTDAGAYFSRRFAQAS
jgi:hypothetical protein